MNLWTWLAGKKTYVVAALTIAFAAVEYWAGGMTQKEAVELVLGSAGLGALRHGLTGTLESVVEGMYAPKVLDAIKAALPAPAPILVAAAPELKAVQESVAAALAAGHSPDTVSAVAGTAVPQSKA